MRRQNRRLRENPPPAPERLGKPALRITGSDQRSITLSWEAVDNAALYEYCHKSAAETDFGEPSRSDRPGLMLDGLEAGTDYTIRVTALPRENSEKYLPSEPASIEARTADIVPTALQAPSPSVAESTHENLKISWEPVPNAVLYGWSYKADGDEDYSPVTHTALPDISLDGLAPETAYTVRVTALPEDNSSLWLESEPGFAHGTTLPEPAVDLNAGGLYANCYIVDRPGESYRFDAKIRGNGAASPGIVPQPLAPKDVFVVWESSPQPGGVISSCTLSDDGLVTFVTAPQIGGNALIAVTDGKPVEGLSRGEILWSWHIWSTGYPDGSDVVYENHDGEHYTLMSCNLGAVGSAPGTVEAAGLHYQWGRKDPFVGFVAGGGARYGSVAEEDYAWEMQPFQTENSIELAVAYPTVFFSGSYASGNDWYYGGGHGAAARNNNLWGNPAASPAEAVKTIYDPCPAGYRVAPEEAFTGFTTTGKTAVKVSEMNVAGQYDEGWNFRGDDGAQSFFPSAGYMVFSSGVVYSDGGYNGAGFYATSTPDGESARMVRIEKSMLMYASTQRATGCSVRCMKE